MIAPHIKCLFFEVKRTDNFYRNKCNSHIIYYIPTPCSITPTMKAFLILFLTN